MEFKDYYKILGVEPDADAKTIKTAYRKLARQYHPDVNPEPEAEDKFKEVAEAYEVLKNTERRAEYDELRRWGGGRARGDGFEPPPGWQSRAQGGYSSSFSGEEFSEFFSNIFGDGFREARHGGGEGFSLRGQDIEVEMPVFLEETLHEHSKPVKYRVPSFENGQLAYTTRSMNVKIPAGVSEGQRIRVKGQGAPGRGGGPAGDLYLHIRLVPHPLYDVEGHDLTLTLPIAPWEAALGAQLEVPLLEGRVKLTVKPHSKSGQRMRIRGKGLPGPTGQGDLYVVLNIVMPEYHNDKTDELWQKLAREAAFDPRADWNKERGK
jgi:curved DNA-binding protein